MQAPKLFLLPLLFCCVTFSCLTLTSCVQPTHSSSAALEGNWHIAGQLGNAPLQLVQSPLIAFSMGVSGSTVYANGSIDVTCTNGGAIGGSMYLTGSIASDGTFTLTNASEPLDSIQITIHGKVPAGGATAWSGSYTLANASDTSCAFNQSSSFVATLYPPLNGTYSGTITGPGYGSGITVTVQISQGQFTSASAPRSSAPTFFIPLSSSISVVGSSSYTSGSTSAMGMPMLTDGVAGNYFGLDYTMNDGTSLFLVGWFSDSSESTLQVQLDSGLSTSTISNICTLTRQ